MSNVVNPFGGAVSDDQVIDWLSQFEASEQGIAEKLLANFRFYGFSEINAGLRDLHRRVLDAAGKPEKIWYVPVGYVAKSGAAIAYFYKTQNDIPQERFILFSDLKTVDPEDFSVIVFIDDYIGSGHQATQVWNALLSLNLRLGDHSLIIFAALVGTRRGIEHLSSATRFRVCVGDIIEESDLPLSLTSAVFENEGDRTRAREVLEKYGARLYPKAPLGYANSQGLLGFIYSTPNNTLPIFWSTEGGWKPLLPHKESYRDPAFLFGPPYGLPREAASSSPAKPLVESAALSEYEIPPEIASKIFTEFRRTDIFLVLAPVVRKLQINESTFSQLLYLIGRLKHLVHEQRALSSSLLVVPVSCPLDARPLVAAAREGTTLADFEEVLSLVQLLQASEGALIIRPDGQVLGSTLFPPASQELSPLLPSRYHRAAKASKITGGLLFFFTGDGRVGIFYQGERLLVYRGASWHLQPSDLETGVRTLAKRYQLNFTALFQVFQICLRLSDEGHGALVAVGDHDNVLAIAEAPKTDHIQWPTMRVGSTETEAILGLMRQDGATIITADGTILQGMTTLRPPADAPGALEVGRGTKHATAAKISGATRCLAIAVSVDGRITIYASGEIVLKIMA